MSFQYFDLHIHPVFKTLFRGRKTKISGWTDIDVPDRLLGNCFESQSSLNQLLCTQSKTNLICVGDHAPEMGTLDQWILRAASTIVYRQFLERSHINQMANGNISYGMVHTEELLNLLEKAPPLPNGRVRKVKILKAMGEYNENDFDTLHIVFHVEGSHMFYTNRNQSSDLPRMLANVDRYLEQRLLLYVTITHLTPNVFCNHAYGNKFLAKGKLLPYKSGLRLYGRALVEKLYSKNVLVDLKHMSWVARKELYEFRALNGWQNIPLIASHIGLTGFSVKDRINYIKPVAGLKLGKDIVKIRYNRVPGIIPRTHFNPNSINFYDDDILEILKSKGLMGISFDNRILGAADPTELEFITSEEIKIWNVFFTTLDKIVDPVPYKYRTITREEDEIMFDEEDKAAAEEEFHSLFPTRITKSKTAVNKQRQRKNHLEHFINQLLKIKQVADKHPVELIGINPWDHICIGSDFDGLISALHCCMNTKQVEGFAKLIEKNLQGYADVAGIPLGMAVPDIVEKIFFKNGYEFLRRYFGP